MVATCLGVAKACMACQQTSICVLLAAIMQTVTVTGSSCRPQTRASQIGLLSHQKASQICKVCFAHWIVAGQFSMSVRAQVASYMIQSFQSVIGLVG